MERKARPLFLGIVFLWWGLWAWCISTGTPTSLRMAEERVLDGAYPLLDLARGPAPVDPRIVVVRLEDSLFDQIGQPFSRWADDYARGISRLFEAGAQVVAFDVLFHPRLDKLPESDSDPILGEIEEFARLVLERPVVLVEAYRKGDAPERSTDLLHLAADSQGRVAAANLHSDDDEKVRFLAAIVESDPPHRVRNLPIVLAGMLEGFDYRAEGSRVSGLPFEDGLLRVRYPTLPGKGFRSLGFDELLSGSPLPDLSGTVCLVGPCYEGSNDRHATSWGERWGVEIHAATLNTVLTKSYLLSAPAPVSWGLLAVFTCLGVNFGLRLNSPLAQLMTAGTLLGLGWSATFLALGLFERILPGVAFALSGLGAQAAAVLYRQLTVERSRRHIRGVLGRFVSPQVMSELLSAPERLALGGSRRKVTVLFADINNFTPLCEKKSPEQVIEMLNSFFHEMVAIIFAHGGTVKQFVGDQIMVIYNAPEAMEDHAAQAVRTAAAMVARLQELKAHNAPESGFYEIKVGIHTGVAVVGNVGSELRSEYAAVGDSVNLAARIEALSGKLDVPILVSADSKSEAEMFLDGSVEFRSHGVHHFKGKSETMEVFAPI